MSKMSKEVIPTSSILFSNWTYFVENLQAEQRFFATQGSQIQMENEN